MHLRSTLTGLLSLAIVSTGLPVMGSQLYAQLPDYNGAFSSQNDTTGGNGNFATTYDNFSLAGSSFINNVQWIGSYFNPATQGPITAFTVNFYSDNAGQPGALLQSFNVAGTNGETFLQNDNSGDPTYLYNMNVGFVANPGIVYWLSVVPNLGFPPQWGWETATGGDGVSYQDFFGTRSKLGADLSFALNGVAAPEPFTFGLIGFGMAGLGLVKFIRNRA